MRYSDGLMYHFFAFSTYLIVASLYVLTAHVTVCECRTELKGYLLNLFTCGFCI